MKLRKVRLCLCERWKCDNCAILFLKWTSVVRTFNVLFLGLKFPLLTRKRVFFSYESAESSIRYPCERWNKGNVLVLWDWTLVVRTFNILFLGLKFPLLTGKGVFFSYESAKSSPLPL